MIADVAEAHEVHERPQAGETKIGQHVVLSRLRRRHLLKKILARDEGHRREEAYEADPYAVRAHRVIAVDDAHVFLVLALSITVGPNGTKHNEGEQLKLKVAKVTQQFSQ